VTPGEFLEIMRLARNAALSAGKLRPALRLQHDLQNMGLPAGVEALVDQPPRR